MVGSMENWRCIVCGLNRLNEGGRGEIRVTKISEFGGNENLTTDSATSKIQQVFELL